MVKYTSSKSCSLLFRLNVLKSDQSLLVVCINAFGAYQDYYQSSFLSSETPSTISWIGTIQGSLIAIAGSITGPIYDRGHCRQLIFTGTFLVTFSTIMTSLYSSFETAIVPTKSVTKPRRLVDKANVVCFVYLWALQLVLSEDWFLTELFSNIIIVYSAQKYRLSAPLQLFSTIITCLTDVKLPDLSYCLRREHAVEALIHEDNQTVNESQNKDPRLGSFK